MTAAPSSSRRFFANDPRLEHVRGQVRDAIAALHNLEQVLGSIRVAPKAIEALLPDAVASCGDVNGWLAELVGALAPLPDQEGPRAVLAHAEATLHELGRALGEPGPLNAARRLPLERAVTRAVQQLEAVRWLVDLLEDAAFGLADRADLPRVLRDLFAREPEGVVTRPTRLRAPDTLELSTRPRALGKLVAAAASLIPGERATLALVRTEDGGAELSLDATGGAGETLSLPVLQLTPATESCLLSAAAALGGSLAREGDTVALWFPDHGVPLE